MNGDRQVIASVEVASRPHVRGRGDARRNDLQGHRAVAVASVVLTHAGATWLPGGFVGVDLFFVLSGFLITGLLIREWSERGSVSLVGFWARRTRRILPASALVLVATLVATYLFVPANEVGAIATDGLWAALFAENWRMAQQGTDYWAQERSVSPFQHYWSLGVEEQFYLAWPLLVVGLGAIAYLVVRRLRPTARPDHVARWLVGGVALLVSVASFAYAVRLTGTDQPYAYFGTFSRIWQLGLGAALAAGLPVVARIRPRPALLLGLAGIVGLAYAFVAFTDARTSTGYPGWMALVPTLSAGALVASGAGAVTTAVGRALSVGPLVWLGDISYSLYLWHFPILVIGAQQLAPAGWPVRVALVLASVAAAALTFRFLEDPVRRSRPLTRRPRVSLLVGVGLVATSCVAASVLPRAAAGRIADVELTGGSTVDLSAQLENPGAGYPTRPGGCIAVGREVTEPGACDDFGAQGASRRVVLLGDSHASAISYGLARAAKGADYGLTVWVKPGCKFVMATTYVVDTAFTRYCAAYRENVVRKVLADPPDLVVLTSATDQKQRMVVDGSEVSSARSREVYVAGMKKMISTFTDAGIPVTVLGDSPRVPGNETSAACLLRTHSEAACTFRRIDTWRPEVEAARSLGGSGLVRLVDLANYWCRDERCDPIVGGNLVYRNLDHISVAFSTSLAPKLVSDVLVPAAR